jgi:hypothetical protein
MTTTNPATICRSWRTTTKLAAYTANIHVTAGSGLVRRQTSVPVTSTLKMAFGRRGP